MNDIPNRRISIIGISGSGKSVFARKLAAELQLPLFHMDTLFWKGKWEAIPEKEYLKNHQKLIQGDRWIVEGYIDEKMSDRLLRSDLVIFLDYPGWFCVWRVFLRWLTHRKQSRSELPKEANEKLAGSFLWRVFTRKERVSIKDALKKANPQNLHVVRSPKELKKIHVNKVLILTGPGGAGKTTIAEMFAKQCGFVLIDGDDLDTEFFPDGNQWLPENSEKLRLAHDKILAEAKTLFNQGKSVVVDYIIFGRYLEFFEKFKTTFGNSLEIKVLFPSHEECIKRDGERKSWHTGVDRITAVRTEFASIKDELGVENFIDTSGETPEITFQKHFGC
jgi:adenylate kinase family enzyme